VNANFKSANQEIVLSIIQSGNGCCLQGRPRESDSEVSKVAFCFLITQNTGKILNHGQISQEVWGSTFAEETQYLRIYIAQLRKEPGRSPLNRRLPVTEAGIGYGLNENPA
jgi:DNA-binding response OmpR family regulator